MSNPAGEKVGMEWCPSPTHLLIKWERGLERRKGGKVFTYIDMYAAKLAIHISPYEREREKAEAV
jgi:hypothetical protein